MITKSGRLSKKRSTCKRNYRPSSPLKQKNNKLQPPKQRELTSSNTTTLLHQKSFYQQLTELLKFAIHLQKMASLPEFITRELVLKFLKFGMVGFSGLVVDFGITWLFKEKIKIERFIANAIGFSVAATSNYFLNRIWTYESHNPKVMVEFTQFFIIAMMGLVINTIIIWLLDRKFSFNFYLAKLIAIGVVTLWNFMANTYITFA